MAEQAHALSVGQIPCKPRASNDFFYRACLAGPSGRTVIFVTAKARRPSGNWASTSIQQLPALVGMKVNSEEHLGSLFCDSQTIRAELKSNPGAWREICICFFAGICPGRPAMPAAVDFQG